MNTKPEDPTFEVGSTVNLSDLPRGSVLSDANYWYFLTDALLALMRSIPLDREALQRHFTDGGVDPAAILMILPLFIGRLDVEKLAGQLFSVLPRAKEEAVMEDALLSVLLYNGHSYRTPQGRGKMGKALLDMVTTPLVSNEEKRAYVMRFGESVMQRIIAQE